MGGGLPGIVLDSGQERFDPAVCVMSSEALSQHLHPLESDHRLTAQVAAGVDGLARAGIASRWMRVPPVVHGFKSLRTHGIAGASEKAKVKGQKEKGNWRRRRHR